MNIILLGAPGAGKGTQAAKICQAYNIPHISTGDIFRKNIKEQTKIGIRVKEILDRGLLVPDDIVIEIVAERLKEQDVQQGYLLDGFPRTTEQAQALQKLASIDVVLNIDADLKKLEQRLCGRRVCPKCQATYHITTHSSPLCKACQTALIHRDDDAEDTVKNRLCVYQKQTEPLIQYYQSQGILKTVDGMQPIDKVFEDILEILQ